jgi:methionine-rich copper-binding protein CopC
MDALGSYRPHAHTQMRLFLHRALSACVASTLSVAAFQGRAEGHSFPIRSEPRVGWTIADSPRKVTIWFDGELEPVFSTIAVYNSAKQQVDKNNSRVGGSDNTVLEVDLPPLPAGSYRVYWKALSKDTHVTEGDFSFTIAAKGK